MRRWLSQSLLLAMFTLSARSARSQALHWYEPTRVEGIAVFDPQHPYLRVPAADMPQLRPALQHLATHTAGEYLHFRTKARRIVIRYVRTEPPLNYPHMPLTGTSGLDLYGVDMNGAWRWAPARYRFSDTCQYSYDHLDLPTHKGVGEFYLYMPLYNGIRWLAVGVPEGDSLYWAEPRRERPIVAYGTSILQGAVASRPGLAWTNILERRLDRPVINLGFSGHGQFEAPIFQLMAKVDAQAYILDCMPNLTAGYGLTDQQILDRLRRGIQLLQAAHPQVPIVLAEHADGYGPDYMDTARLNSYHRASTLMARMDSILRSEGVQHLHLLTDSAIGFDADCTTEGLHPNDIGMMRYADAYERLLRPLIHEPVGPLLTEQPVEQYRDGFDWLARHDQICRLIQERHPQVLLLGNSIVNYWAGQPVPESGLVRGPQAWARYLHPLGVQNAGFGWDRIENVLWRIYHGELDDFQGRTIVVMIGTNNIGISSDADLLQGLEFLLTQIHQRKPDCRLIMAGILPRRGQEAHVKALDQAIRRMVRAHHWQYVDIGSALLNRHQRINDAFFVQDGLHPDAAGYEILGAELARIIRTTP